MKKRFLLALLATVGMLQTAGAAERLTSPKGDIVVVVDVQNGKPTYEVSLSGVQFLKPSPLGLLTNIGDFTDGLTLAGCDSKTQHDEYWLKTTKQSHISYDATEAVCRFEKDGKRVLDIQFHITDRDVAYRYKLYPKKIRGGETLVAVVNGEASGFVMPDGTTTFLCPQSGPMNGFARTSPSYETSYTLDDQMGKNGWGNGFTFPCLFKTPAGWLLLSEAGTDGGYVGCRLLNAGGSNYKIGFPQEGEMNGFGTTSAAVSLPCETPWRTITLGQTLKPIVETTISYDLVEPRYEASTDYKPGRYTWSWLIWQDKSINYDDQVKFIDLASAMGFEYCLVDNWWDTQIGRDRIAELSKYAQSKGVHLLLWYNSNGYANDAPQGPQDCMNTAIAREREMKWMQSIGIKGIKVDFFGGDKQEVMRLYEDILSDANRYGLQVVFHGCTIPRGWERMYPNFVASEAVLASENVFFNEGAAIKEPFDLCLHPFCRNATASMDWGGIIMNKYLAPDNKSRHPRHTTDIFEMASGLIMQTSVQCVAMQPNNLTELPQFEMDFLRGLPTTWEETRFIDGYPGKYIILARKALNAKWYVAGLSAEKEPLTLTLDLPMFEAGETLQYYVDDKKSGEPTLTTLKIDKKGQAKVTLLPNGGLILCR